MNAETHASTSRTQREPGIWRRMQAAPTGKWAFWRFNWLAKHKIIRALDHILQHPAVGTRSEALQQASGLTLAALPGAIRLADPLLALQQALRLGLDSLLVWLLIDQRRRWQLLLAGLGLQLGVQAWARATTERRAANAWRNATGSCV